MNDLVIVDKIEKRLRERREPVIFPLTPTHRKELRELRDRNIGGLSGRLITIRTLKKEEYTKKYSKIIEKELAKKSVDCKILNDDWKKRIEKINSIISDRKTFEKSIDLEFLNLKNDWSTIGKLQPIPETERKYEFDKNNVINQIAEREFKKKYDLNFNAIQKKIDDIVTKYEEAINFGDLEIVKELYYIMKTSDKLFQKIDMLKV